MRSWKNNTEYMNKIVKEHANAVPKAAATTLGLMKAVL